MYNDVHVYVYMYMYIIHHMYSYDYDVVGRSIEVLAYNYVCISIT